MGWTIIQEEDDSIYLATDDGKKLRDQKSVEFGPLSSVAGGRTAGEIWLFRSLQGVADAQRTPFLTAAVGTNGLKQARHAATACKERLLQQVLAKGVGMTVDEAMEVYPDEMEDVKKFSDTSITKAKVPSCILDFIKKVQDNTTETREDTEISIIIKVNGQECKGKEIEEIKRGVMKKVEKIIKRQTQEE